MRWMGAAMSREIVIKTTLADVLDFITAGRCGMLGDGMLHAFALRGVGELDMAEVEAIARDVDRAAGYTDEDVEERLEEYTDIAIWHNAEVADKSGRDLAQDSEGPCGATT